MAKGDSTTQVARTWTKSTLRIEACITATKTMNKALVFTVGKKGSTSIPITYAYAVRSNTSDVKLNMVIRSILANLYLTPALIMYPKGFERKDIDDLLSLARQEMGVTKEDSV